MKNFGRFFITVTYHKVAKTETFSVIIRVQFGGVRQDLYTGIIINKHQWDKKRMRIKQGCNVCGMDYNIINKHIDEQVEFVCDFFNDHFQREAIPTLETLKLNFNNYYKKSNASRTVEFFNTLNKYIENRSVIRTWGKATKQKWIRLGKHLAEFKTDIKFTDFSEAFMTKFLLYLSETKKNDTISKELATLNEFLTWAKDKKYPVNEDFFAFHRSLKLEEKSKDVRFLTVDELKQIIELKLKDGSALDVTRDLLFFNVVQPCVIQT